MNLGQAKRSASVSESHWAAVMEALESHLNSTPRYAHRWELGDLLVVDNHRVIHRATPASGTRVLDRVNIVKLRHSLRSTLRATNCAVPRKGAHL